MNISSIKPNLSINQKLLAGDDKNQTIFKDFFDSAVDLLNETNSLEKKAETTAIDFAAGKIDSIEDVMVAQEKANIALQFTVNLRNQLITAYNEIMRIQM